MLSKLTDDSLQAQVVEVCGSLELVILVATLGGLWLKSYASVSLDSISIDE